LAGDALEAPRRADWQRMRREDLERGRFIKGTRLLLRRRADALSGEQRDLIEGLAATNERVYRGWLHLDQLRAIYAAADPQQTALLLGEWCESAWRSDLPEFRKVARTFTDHADAIVNAIHLGINNARIEAMNSTVRLMNHRSRGFWRVESLLA
jgi:transposase